MLTCTGRSVYEDRVPEIDFCCTRIAPRCAGQAVDSFFVTLFQD